MNKKLVVAALAATCWPGPLSGQSQNSAASAEASGTNAASRPLTAETRPLASPKAYVLAPNDVILVEVFQEDDLRAERRVSEDGTVSLPLLERVGVGGKTVEEATALVREKLARDYLVNPQVTVTVTKPRTKKFTVLGEVQKPGPYEISAMNRLTLVEAIATAGGRSGKGNLSRVAVSRQVEGRTVVFNDLDVNAMSRHQGSAQFEVLDGDTITVKEKIF